MRPQDYLLNFILDRVVTALFAFVVILAFLGWFGFFRLKEQRDQIRVENAQIQQDLKDTCAELNSLRANIAGGWPIIF